MSPHSLVLIALNVVGGAAVLASYAVGLGSDASAGSALWGGIPERWRPLYTLNMFLAAGGYFLFAPYIAFRLEPAHTLVAGRFGYSFFTICFALVLVGSAIWLPLTQRMIAEPNAWMWALVRLDLALVALGSLGLLVGLLALDAGAPSGRALALVGLVPFVLQTAVLDALLWPALFPAPTP